MNFDSLIEALTCPLSSGSSSKRPYRHFYDNPKYLPCCHRTACNKCILRYLTTKRNSLDYMLTCPFCDIVSRVSLVDDECKLDSDNLVSVQLEKNLIEINHYLIRKLENSVKTIEDRFASKENSLNKRKAFIENEIHVQIENLKDHLDLIEAEMKQNLEVSTRNMKSNLEKFEEDNRGELEEIKTQVENLRTNTLLYINGDLKNNNKTQKINQTLQNQTIEGCISKLNEISEINHSFNEMMNELTFEPAVELPSKSIIGNLKQINDINLAEQLKNIKSQFQITKIESLIDSSQKAPISPRYACIADKQTLLFTDSQSRHLIQLRLETGDFIRSTNLNGLFKNPDGICVNPKKGHIYVGDSELKCIFKLDYDFNLLKRFGMKDLKWPKGLYYDYETKFTGDNLNPDRLFVCDYAGQRVAVYNEHDQLRDYLIIPYTDNSQLYSPQSDNFTNHRNSITDDEYKFCPLNVKVSKSFIFVTDDWTGENCIRVFDKQTHQLVRNLGDLNAWNPLGLILDDAGNLFTAARLYYETGQTNLFCFNIKNNELLYKKCLNVNSDCVTDLILDKYTDRGNNRIICVGDKKIHFILF
ncbi:unnamed protein product [Brachionus calyciflorus]|uniref:Uncharacterized protein n=1 Tax=Brachionus calyciflorus TaxID=104777 RepID=A0A814BEP1_9BILA|nr:unnamed protein product [Brachionus calyciflorus]